MRAEYRQGSNQRSTVTHEDFRLALRTIAAVLARFEFADRCKNPRT